MGSESASKDVNDADEGACIPFDGDSAIDFVVPEAGAGNVESTVGFLHDDAVGNEFEIFVDGSDCFENLNGEECTSSQI